MLARDPACRFVRLARKHCGVREYLSPRRPASVRNGRDASNDAGPKVRIAPAASGLTDRYFGSGFGLRTPAAPRTRRNLGTAQSMRDEWNMPPVSQIACVATDDYTLTNVIPGTSCAQDPSLGATPNLQREHRPYCLRARQKTRLNPNRNHRLPDSKAHSHRQLERARAARPEDLRFPASGLPESSTVRQISAIAGQIGLVV